MASEDWRYDFKVLWLDSSVLGFGSGVMLPRMSSWLKTYHSNRSGAPDSVLNWPSVL